MRAVKAEWERHKTEADGENIMITFNKNEREGAHLKHFGTRSIAARIIYEPAQWDPRFFPGFRETIEK